MSITVRLLSSADDPRVLNKTFTTIATVTAQPTENCSLITPTIILAYNISLIGVTHFYVNEWQKYFFVTALSVSPGSKTILSGSVDFLTTYNDDIRQCMATVVRSESVGAPTMIPDNKLPINPNKKELKTAVYQFKGSAAADVHTPRYFMKIKYSPTAYIPSNERGESNANK